MHARRTVSSIGTPGFRVVHLGPGSVMSNHSSRTNLHSNECKECIKLNQKGHKDARKPKFCEKRKLMEDLFRDLGMRANLSTQRRPVYGGRSSWNIVQDS